MKNILNIIIWVALFIWQLPQNIVALLMLPFVGGYKLKCIKRRAWCIICDGMRLHGSISLGNFVLLGDSSDLTCAHELGHVKDSHLFGPLYLLIIGIPSIIWASGIDTLMDKTYYSFYTERRANRNSHIHDGVHEYYNSRWWSLDFDAGYSLSSIK